MDQDFFKQLEESFSNVGTDECWQRTIGGRKVWFSPIPVTGQAKVQETITSKDLGSNVLNESKRISLSHAIVGMGEMDLRPYRHAGNVFGPIPDPRDPKKKTMLDLPGYVYMKMATWGAQWMDDAFSVFADLMETHQKENVKSVTFENSKNPIEELGELMVRVTELRMQLKLPPLEEVKKAPEQVDEVKEFEASMEEEARLAEAREAARAKREAPEPEPTEAFDPFRPMAPAAPDVRPRPAPQSVQEFQPPQPPAPQLPPVVTVPVPVPAYAQPPSSVLGVPPRPIASFDNPGPPQSSPQQPFQTSPSVPSDVVEQPAARVTTAPPIIDPTPPKNINPRYNPQAR